MRRPVALAYMDLQNVLIVGLWAFVVVLSVLLDQTAAQVQIKDAESPGTVMVEIRWPDDLATDVDLWVLSPSDVNPVGYSNLNGYTTNLLRDDVGRPDALNYENAYTRGAPAGEYIVNVHLYQNLSHAKEIPVEVSASVRVPSKIRIVITRTTVVLRKIGDEVTAFRFRLDGSQAPVPGSVNQIPRMLREAK